MTMNLFENIQPNDNGVYDYTTEKTTNQAKSTDRAIYEAEGKARIQTPEGRDYPLGQFMAHINTKKMKLDTDITINYYQNATNRNRRLMVRKSGVIKEIPILEYLEANGDISFTNYTI